MGWERARPELAAGPQPRDDLAIAVVVRVVPVSKSKVHLHAVDATSARWRGGAGLSPLSVSGAALSPRNDFHTESCQ